MICQEKKKCFRDCSQCNEKYCIECYNKIHKNHFNPCPYCRYEFINHFKNNYDDILKSLEGGQIECYNDFHNYMLHCYHNYH